MSQAPVKLPSRVLRPPSVTPQGGQAPLQHDVAFSDDLEKLALRNAWLPTCSSPQSEHFNI